MSHDEGAARGLGDVLTAAARRVRLLALAEAVAFGAAAAAISSGAGALVVLAVAAWRWRATRRGEIIRSLERTEPSARNLFVTADELERGVLTARPAVRARVFADAAASARAVDLRRAYPIAPIVRAAGLACACWATLAAVGLWRGPLADVASRVAPGLTTSDGGSSAARLRVSLTIQPPAYTGLPPTTLVDPEQFQTVEGAALTVTVAVPADGVTVEHDGATRTLDRDGSGRFTGRLSLKQTGYLLVAADAGDRRMIPFVVSPDALPAARLIAPGRDLIYAGGNPRIAFEARATDDYGLRSLVLRYTKVSGSGEQFDFEDGEIPLTVTRRNAREWTGTVSRSLAELNLADGDMLVYRAVAADARPGDGTASSDAFFIEISKLGMAAGDGFTLPEEETRYALSQQMLIIKTERLHQRRSSLAAAELTEASLNLAVEQRMIRAEIVFMLGGEVEDEEVEAEQSTELQEGRLQNRGQRDLRAATIAMSQAEKFLTGAHTGEALAAERAAVAALQRAFTRERYILRALATRSRLDPARRLTGDLSQAVNWRRTPPETPDNRRVALLQDLLRGIAELNAVSSDFRSRAIVLAEEAIRIDPAATLLRQAATELQRAADAADAVERSRAVAAAATAAASEARGAHAEPPFGLSNVAPALTGAFADALRVARRLPASARGEHARATARLAEAPKARRRQPSDRAPESQPSVRPR